MEELLHNKEAFVAIKPFQIIYWLILMTLVLLFFLIYSIRVQVYDNYLTKGYVTCQNTCHVKAY